MSLTKFLQSLFGTSSDREVKKMMPTLQAVRDREASYVCMTNDELRAQTTCFKERLSQAREKYRRENPIGAMEEDEYLKALMKHLAPELEAILPDAFAVVREASKRVVGMRPFDVQVIGGIVLHRSGISERVTGEGKTVVAVMPIYLNALTGDGVRVVTGNDYRARRDSEWMGPIFKFLGLTVGLIQHDMSTGERQVGYRADVTYGTNNEFGFDYLRDNMALRPEMRVSGLDPRRRGADAADHLGASGKEHRSVFQGRRSGPATPER
ncbi:MAG: hypothetical protein NTU83_01245 [Candidatus Hydrogenedentes bacterium]|nr:hypothetical protein [Candidatus Hydrogenedentota bacterium]